MTQTVITVASDVTSHAETGMTTTSAAPFRLKAGRYLFIGTGSFNSNTLSLQILGPDGSTYATVAALGGGASGFATIGASNVNSAVVDVPDGMFQFAASGTLTSVAAAVSRVRGDD